MVVIKFMIFNICYGLSLVVLSNKSTECNLMNRNFGTARANSGNSLEFQPHHWHSEEGVYQYYVIVRLNYCV